MAWIAVYILHGGRKLPKTTGEKVIEYGVEFPAYECTYGLGPIGYEGWLCELTIGPQRFPLKVRMFGNRGLGIRDCDVESPHFNIAAREVANLVIDIERSY